MVAENLALDSAIKWGEDNMNPAQGQCALCGATNPYTKVVCDQCGAQLPWAGAVQPKVLTQQVITSPPLTNSSATPPTAQHPVQIVTPQTPKTQGSPATAANAANKTLMFCVGCGCVAPMLLFFLLWIIGMMGGGGKLGKGAAYVTAHSAIERQLNAPATAKFPASYEPGVTIIESGDTFMIFSYVYSQNSFGGTKKTKWMARVQRTPDGKDMRVISAELLE